ncbi:LysR substrate-binding domain-containing protein [Vibrio sp. F74]|uniref:LysR substrate-binding domain-containing protein n=1 Tax=Vibrio sp. F74 TaxID=700020 RepID=UPI0035F59FFB
MNPLIEREALVQVLPNWTPQEMDIFVLYPSRKHLSPTARALIDFLSDYFQYHKWE